MRHDSAQALRGRIAASGRVPGRFLADETTRISLDSPGVAAADVVGQVADRTVLLACDRQMACARALIVLDGLARRIVLCPPDLGGPKLASVLDACGADTIVTDGRWPDDRGRAVIPVAALEGTGQPVEQDPGAGRAYAPTEWILFTSGTTGRPKMLVHTLRSLADHLPAAGPDGKPVTWCTFYDVRRYGGLQILLRTLVGGGSLVLSCAEEDPGAFLRRAAAAGATHFLGTPSHWRRALMTPEADLIAPDYVRLSGEVADQAILDRLKTRYPNARLVHAFASTEAGLAFQVADGLAGFPAGLLERGAAEGGVDLQVRDGSLRVRSGRVAAGQLDGEVLEVADADGYVDTGDLVERRGDRCYFAGRREGIVNVGGLKVHPEEVEVVINRHPGVRMSLVRARANPILGAVVAAEIVVDPGASGVDDGTLLGEVMGLCRRDLAGHMVPATLRIVPSLEIAPSGKLVR